MTVPKCESSGGRERGEQARFLFLLRLRNIAAPGNDAAACGLFVRLS